MKKLMALLILSLAFSSTMEARGRSVSRSRSAPKRSSSMSHARSAPKMKAPKRSASVGAKPSKSFSAPKRASSMVSHDKFTSQKVRTSGGKVTPVGSPHKIVYSKNKTLGVKQKTYYRGVKDVHGISGGHPDKYVDNAFKNGIKSNARLGVNVPGVKDPKKPAVTNVWQHQNKSAENSVFVATSSSKKVATGFAKGKGGGVFEIQPKTSKVINVNKTVGKSGNPEFKKQKEYLFPNEVPGHEIKAYHELGADGKVVKTTKNPYLKH